MANQSSDNQINLPSLNDSVTLLTKGFATLLYNNPNANLSTGVNNVEETIICKATLAAIRKAANDNIFNSGTGNSNNSIGGGQIDLNISGNTNAAEGIVTIIDQLINGSITSKQGIIKANIKELHDILLGGENSLKSIFAELDDENNGINVDANKIALILAFSSLISSLSALSKTSLLATIRMKFAVKAIANFMKDDIIKLFDIIIAIDNKANKNVTMALKNLSALINSITGIGNITFLDILKMQFLFQELRNVLSTELKDLLNELATISEASEKQENALKDIFNIFHSILQLKDIKFKDIMVLDFKIELLFDEIALIIEKINSIGLINNESVNSITNINEIVKKIDEFTDSLSLTKLIIDYIKLSQLISNVAIIDLLVKKHFSKFIENVNSLQTIDKDKAKLFDADNKEGIIYIIQSINNLSDLISKSKDINALLEVIENINLTIFFIGKILDKTNDLTIEILRKQIVGIKGLIDELSDIKEEDIKKAKEAILTFAFLVVVSTAVLIIGSLAMAFISAKDLLSFTLTLKGFVFGLSWVYKNFSKESKLTLEAAKAFTFIVVASGALLLAAGLLIDDIPILKVALFGVVLAGFIFLISFPYKQFMKGDNKMTVLGAAAFSLILVTSGALLIAAGLLYDSLDLGGILGFAIVLGLFIFGISLIYNKFLNNAGPTMQGALAFSILLVVSGALLLAGSYMWDMMWHGDTFDEKAMNGIKSILFAVLVGFYIRFLSWAISSNKGKTTKALVNAGGVALLVVISGALLLAGSYLWDILTQGADGWEAVKNVAKSILFTVLVAAFIAALCWAVNLGGKQAQKALPMAAGIALLVVVTGGMLLLATYIIKDENDLLKIGIFVVGTLVLVGGMTVLIYLLGEISKGGTLLAGILAMVGIAAILFGLSLIMEKMVETANIMDPEKLLQYLGLMALTLVEITAILFGLGAILFSGIPAAVLALGAIAILPIMGIMSCLNNMMLMVSISSLIVMQNLNKDKISLYFELIGHTIDALYNTIKGTDDHRGLDSFVGPRITPTILAASLAIKQLSEALISMALCVQQWADLRIPLEFDSKGNPKTYMTLNSDAFSTATANIGNAASSLIDPILQLYQDYKDDGVFEFTLFGGTPFQRTVRAIKELGPTLSALAISVQDWANLRIPLTFDEKGNPKTYMTLNSKNFTDATNNIKDSAKALIKGILELYHEYKDDKVFESDDWFGITETPFSKVIKATNKLGPVLSNLAKAMKDWADLRIPTKFDSKGNPIAYATLSGNDFTAATNNIVNVVKALVNGLVESYNNLKMQGLILDQSESSGFNISGLGGLINIGSKTEKKSKLYDIAQSIGIIGMTLGLVGAGLKQWAAVKIPTGYDKDGKPTGYMSLKEGIGELDTNIQLVLTAMGTAIAKVYENDTSGLFDVDRENHPAMIIAKSVNEISGALINMSSVISALIGGKIVEYDKDGKIVKSVDISAQLNEIKKDNGGELGKTITNICTALVKPLEDIYNKKELRSMWNSYNGNKSPAENIASSISIIASSLVEITNKIKEVDDIFKKNNINGLADDIFKNIVDMLGKIVMIYGLFGKPSEMKAIFDKYKTGDAEMINIDTTGFWGIGEDTIAEWMIDQSKDIDGEKGAKQAIISLMGNLIEIITETENFSKKINALAIFKNKELFGIENPNSLGNKVRTILAEFLWMLKTQYWEQIIDNYDEQDITNAHNIMTGISKMLSDPKTGLLIHFAYLAKTINDNKNYLETDIEKLVESLFKNYNTLLEKFNDVKFGLFNDLYRKLWDNKFISKNNYLIETVKSIANIANIISTNSNQIIKNISNVEFDNLNLQISNLITSWTSIIEKIKLLNENSNTIKNETFGFAKEENYSNLKDLLNIINDIIDVNTKLETISISSNAFEELAKGIAIIDIMAQNIKANKALEKQQKVMDNYITSINNIDISKISLMAEFAESMNRLANKLGNLDNLTEAIANKLTVVLANLILEMKRAEDTIKNADKLREKRETLIKNSIKEMKTIMEQHLVVDIYNQSTDQNLGDDLTPTTTEEETPPGATPTYNGNTDETPGPLLTPETTSTTATQFEKNIKSNDAKLTSAINSAINTTLRNIFTRNTKDNTQFTLNLKPGYK